MASRPGRCRVEFDLLSDDGTDSHATNPTSSVQVDARLARSHPRMLRPRRHRDAKVAPVLKRRKSEMDEKDKRRQKEIEDLERDVEELLRLSPNGDDAEEELERLRRQVADLRRDFYAHLGAWQRIQLARHPQRPYTLDYVRLLFEGFSEIHGDRAFADDPALIAAWRFYHGDPVMVIGHKRAATPSSAWRRNFGQAKPEGYRKALRVMQLAAKFGRPIFTFVDTPGAYPGIDAEERGQAEAIARNLREMARLPVPIVVTITGEGGSGGALAIAVGDRSQHAGEFGLLGNFAGRLRLDSVARCRQS